jgi:XTP/dITP diphosphohydrolase
MHRIPVDSSDIISIGYDAENRLLEVEFHEGRIYQYRNVEPDIHEQLMRADSHGQYFDTFIRSRYRYDKIEEGTGTHEQAALTYVTGNGRKFRDLQLAFEPFGISIEQLSLPVDEIQSQEAEEVAVKKAKEAYRLAGRPVVVTDVFWSFLALRGFPGAYMADVARWFKAEDFIRLMAGKTERSVVCTDTLVYYDGKRSKVFTAVYHGKVADAAAGIGVNSINRVLIMEGYSKTVAQVEDEEAKSSFTIATSTLNDFAKWFNMQRKIGKA